MTDHAPALRLAAVRAFEELGLLCVDDTSGADAERAALTDGASIAFAGSRTGRLTLRVTADVLEALAENMLGEEGPHDEMIRRDALGEVANVICGNVLPAIIGTAARLALHPPERRTAMPPGIPHATHIALAVEAGLADVTLELDAPAPAARAHARR